MLKKAQAMHTALEEELDRRPDVLSLYTHVYQPWKDAERSLREEEVGELTLTWFFVWQTFVVFDVFIFRASWLR